MQDNVERGIVVSGGGWIIAGILCMILYTYDKNTSNQLSFLAIGIITIIAGASLILLRKRVLNLREKLLKKQHTAVR
jgi:LPXTG-motif cell wall-anchored protein